MIGSALTYSLGALGAGVSIAFAAEAVDKIHALIETIGALV